jgi:L-2-hydroxyglutarate oxidase LhgO
MQEYEVDCVIAGAGAVGLAAARALASAGREVLVVEAKDRIGTGVSARNSEVIHAGIYYPPGSLKAELCVRGRALLYAFAQGADVAHRRCGKLIVATCDQHGGELEKIAARGAANGVDDLQRLSAAQARALEPQLVCAEALMSPSTGVIDAQSYMRALRHQAENFGASFAFLTRISGGAVREGAISLVCEGRDPCILNARCFVNAAGLEAPALAAALDGFPPERIPQAYWAKGSYFALLGPSPFSRLVYPVPEPGGLGVHLTLDLGGQARFGPDVEWVSAPNYDVDPARGDTFYAAIRRYWPGLKDGALAPAYAGVRPKIAAPGGPDEDFRIMGPEIHGVPGLVHLFGIESPGLTSSLAIAELVAEMVKG